MDGKTVFSLELVDPADVGLDRRRLGALKAAIEEDVENCVCDGAVFIVARHGKVVLFETCGRTDIANDRATRPDDVFFMMSISKQFTAVRVLMDIERGKFALTTPICEVIEEFACKGKHNVTVWNILTHTSGLNTEIPFGLTPDKLASIEDVTAAMSNDRLFMRPGKMVSYNALVSASLLATMVQRLDDRNRPYRRILAEDLFEPLGMTDTALGLPEMLKDRLVPIAVRDKTPGLFDPMLLEAINFLIAEDSEFPAGGAISTAPDVFRFAEMLRRGGELDGARVLAPETVRLATTIQTGGKSNTLNDYMVEVHGWPEFPANLGLSFFIRGAGVFPCPLGQTTSPGTFSGMGTGSTMFWVDPERDLTFVFLSAGLLEDANCLLRNQRLSDLVVASVVG